MTDTNPNPAAFDADLGEDELVFDDPSDIDAVPVLPSTPQPEAKAASAKPRRTPRRGSNAAVEDAATDAAEPSDATLPASAAAEPAVTEEPADPPAPVPQPDAGSAGFSRRDKMLAAVVLLALFTSLVSLGGLIAVGRTLAHAEADRARAEDERAALVRVPAMVKALDDASARLALAASRTPTGPATGAPVSADDLRHALDDLRLSMAARQPDSLTPLTGMTRDGFSELGTRLDRLSTAVERMKGGSAPVR